MNRAIYTYFKRNGLTDAGLINRLLLSSFLRHYQIVPKENTFLSGYYIKECSDEMDMLVRVIKQLENMRCAYSLENLTELFEYVISPLNKKITGSVYTPKYIREHIVETVTNEMGSSELYIKRFADISCGCGGFFYTIADYIHNKTGKSYSAIIQENLCGVDLQEYAIERTKLLLSLQALLHGEDSDLLFDMHVADSLDFDFSNIGPVDIIVGNPPYVCSRNVSMETRNKMLHYEVAQSGHPDLYIPFFQIAAQMLNDSGRMGYITMNSFLRSINGRKLRDYFSTNKFDISIVDFRGYQIFPTKNTYTCLFFLQKDSLQHSIKYVTCENGDLTNIGDYTSIDYALLNSKKGWALNDFNHTLSQEKVGTSLGKLCQSRHGIATLCNKVYIFKPIKEDEQYYYFLDHEKCVSIEKSICRDVINSNKLNSNVEFESIKEKVIFPYQRQEDGRMTIIPEKIMRERYHMAYTYLLLHKNELLQRDKGNTSKYPAWYAFGRTQSLTMPRYKLFFPKIANNRLHTIMIDDPDLLLYNGIAFISDTQERLLVIRRVLESDIFWQYIVKNSKPYANGYYSICGTDIMNFGVPLSEDN